MLSESMLQKFSTKIEQLVSSHKPDKNGITQQNQEEEAHGPSMPETDNKKKMREAPLSYPSQDKIKTNFQQNKLVSVFSQSEDDKIQQSEKVSSKQLSRLIALEKERLNASAKSSLRPPTVKKTASNFAVLTGNYCASTGVKQTPQVKPTIQMPKVTVMNNLIKLSTKLERHELLRQIKYQSTVLSMASARFLMYFCIQKIIFSIYVRNGAEKMSKRQKDMPFLMKNIQLALLELIVYLRNPQRSMLTRVLQGVFLRFQISSCFSEKWLTQCIREHKQMLQQASVNVQQLQNVPATASITSNIFVGIPTPTKKINYDFPSLELEDEAQSQQKIQDPQIFHCEPKLFFYSASFNRSQWANLSKKTTGNSYSQPIKQQLEGISKYPSYSTRVIEIEIKKLQIPQNAKIFRSQGALDAKPLEQSFRSEEDSDSQQIPKKRHRAIELQSFKQQIKTNEIGHSKLDRRKIAKAIQDYISDHLEQMVVTISDKLSMSGREFGPKPRQGDLEGRQPSKRNNDGREAISQKQKEQSDGDIIKQIENKSTQLERQSVSHKELVKEIFRLLESKNLSHEKKEDIMEKWIAYRRQKKSQR